MKIFISTPINGRNEPTFQEKRQAAHRRAKMLKAYMKSEYPHATVVTPFDAVPLDSNLKENEAVGECISLLLTCDTILLDRGWTASKGCNLEYRAAKLYELHIIDGNGQIPE